VSGKSGRSDPRRRAARQVEDARRLLHAARKALAAAAGPSSPPHFFAGVWHTVNRALVNHGDALRKVRGFAGHAIGLKVENGVETEEPCVVVFVRRKHSSETLRRRGWSGVPDHLPHGRRRVPTDVVEIGAPVPQAGEQACIGRIDTPTEFGTLGALARDLASGEPVAITAMHVAGLTSYERTPGSPGIDFSMPGRSFDPAAPAIGSLIAGTTTGIDAAKISVTDFDSVATQVAPLAISGSRPIANDVGTAVRLFGTVSGLQSGVIKYLNANVWSLTNAILASIQSDNGDSGAGLVDNSGLLLGFLFGLVPTSTGDLRAFSPASVVLQQLRCTIS
jgi:hypothetical protein